MMQNLPTLTGTALDSRQLYGELTATVSRFRSPAMMSQLVRHSGQLSASLTDRNPGQAATLIERLAGHYWRPERDQYASAAWAADWVSDIGHLPPLVISDACTEWRRSPARFMPTPGEFLAIAEKHAKNRRGELARCEELAEELAKPVEPAKPEATAEERARIAEGLRTMFKAVG
jgi:hypothetical protein